MKKEEEEKIRKEFVERYSKEFEGKYKFLITLVGTTPEPLIRTILSVKPEKVGFLYTEEVEWALNKVVEDTELKASEVEKKKIEGSKVEEVYEAIGELARANEAVCIDISGGKKTMVGGAVVAGCFYDLAIVYNDFKEYDVELRRPKRGSEFLAHLTNPFETSQDILYKIAREAFNQYNYGEAQRLLEEARKKTRNVARSMESKILMKLASGYLAWDTFEFEKAGKQIKEAKEEIERFGLKIGVSENKLREHEEILKNLSGLTAREYYPRVLKDKERVKKLVYSCIGSAKRRKKSARYEDAVLRLYRACELIAQHRLALHDVNTAEVSEGSMDEEVMKRYREKKSEIISRKPEECVLRERIGLLDSYVLLEAFNDELMKREVNLKSLYEAIEVRNQSYVEHGIRVVKKRDFERMEKEAVRILEAFCYLYELNRSEEEEEKYKFPILK